MDDRRFLRLLAIVVASGLMLGLVAFSASRRTDAGAVVPGSGAAPAATAAAARAPSASISNSDQGAPLNDPLAQQQQPGSDGHAGVSTEPPPPPATPATTRAATSLDPPNAAVANVPTAAPAAPADPSQPSSLPPPEPVSQ